MTSKFLGSASTAVFLGGHFSVCLHTHCAYLFLISVYMCSSCVHSRVHVSVLYASIKSSMYAFCDVPVYMSVHM